jgi:hypothetical protein
MGGIKLSKVLWLDCFQMFGDSRKCEKSVSLSEDHLLVVQIWALETEMITSLAKGWDLFPSFPIVTV